MRELSLIELNSVSGGTGFFGSTTAAQFAAIGGLTNSGGYIVGNIIRKQESTIAGFTSSLVSGMAAGALGAGVAKVSSTATGAAFGIGSGNYTTAMVGAGFERLIQLGAEKLSNTMADLGL